MVMRTISHFIFATTTLAALSAGTALAGQGGSAGVAPDNTKVNQRDNGTVAATADQQSNDHSDVDVSRRIRRALTDDKSLSTDAQNVKIITRGGHVLLKGPVKSKEEMAAVEKIAIRAAGTPHVKSELTVAAH